MMRPSGDDMATTRLILADRVFLMLLGLGFFTLGVFCLMAIKGMAWERWVGAAALCGIGAGAIVEALVDLPKLWGIAQKRAQSRGLRIDD